MHSSHLFGLKLAVRLSGVELSFNLNLPYSAKLFFHIGSTQKPDSTTVSYNILSDTIAR